MSKFKYLFFVLFNLSASTLYAQADVYLATGVLTAEADTKEAMGKLEKDLKASNPDIYGSEPFKSAYNTSRGFWDFIEGASQLLGQNGWSKYWNSFLIATDLALEKYYIDYFTGLSSNHTNDLTEQIKNYKNSINAGNQVIVIAHSQGNFFTNEAYAALNDCQKKSFYMLGTANPANMVSGEDDGRGVLATLDNDPITFVPSSMSPNIINNDKFIIEGYSFKLPRYHYFDYYRYSNVVTQGKIASFPEYAMNHFESTGNKPMIPNRGIINVQLTWDNPFVDMDLDVQMPFGKKNDLDICTPLEHYYVESEDDVVAGTYPIYINNPKEPQESLLPQNIYLAIDTPGEAMTINFSVGLANMLQVGHIADIVISEDKTATLVDRSDSIGHLAIVTHYGGNSTNSEAGDASGTGGSAGGGNESDNNSSNDDNNTSGNTSNENSYSDYVYAIQSKLKQATLGPLSNAVIELSIADNFSVVEPLYTGSTMGGSSLLSSGVFYFPKAVLSALEDEKLYVLSIKGGTDIDANDDGVIDSNATVNNGTIRAIVSGAQLKNEDIKVNVLTEVTFQLTKQMLNEELNVAVVVEHMDLIAQKLLFSDVEGDELSDYNDTLHWLPMFNKDNLQFDYDEKLEPIVQKIYNNEDIYLDVYKLLYAGKTDDISVDTNGTDSIVRIKTNDIADLSQLQQENIVLRDSNGTVVDFTFEVQNGVLVIYPATTFVEGDVYTIEFSLEITDGLDNSYVDTHLHALSLPDTTPPVIPENTIHIAENFVYWTSQLAIDTSMPLTSTIIGGADKEKFKIVSGYSFGDALQFTEIPNYERPVDSNGDNVYEVDVSIADSAENTITQSFRIIVDDIVEGAELADTNLTVDENAPVGTYVGSVTIVSEGDGNLSEVYLFDNEEFFSINTKGEIFTKAVFDFEWMPAYLFDVGARNSSGEYANRVTVSVDVNDVDEWVPIVHPFTGSMDEHAPAGKVVGQLYVYPGLDSNVSIRFVGDGADDFDINASGHVTVSETANLDHTVRKQYDLKAIANNGYGDSDEANATIYVNAWTRQFGTALDDKGSLVGTDGANNVYLGGTMENFFLRKYDRDGVLLWTCEYPEILKVNAVSMAVDANGTIYLAGTQGTDYRDVAWIGAFATDGEPLWSTTLDSGTYSSDAFKKVMVSTDGDVIVAGNTSGSFTGYVNSGGYDIFVARLSAQGETRWISQFGSSSYDYAKDIALNADGELYLLASQGSNTLTKFDQSSGDIIWSKEFVYWIDGTGTYYEELATDSANNIYILVMQEESWDEIDGSYHYDLNVGVAKMDVNGMALWSKVYGTDEYETPTEIAVNSNDEIYVTGDAFGDLYNNYLKIPYSPDVANYDRTDLLVMQIDGNGNMLKTRLYGSVKRDGMNDMCIDTENNILLTGYVSDSFDGNTPLGKKDAFLMKVPY